MDNAHNDGSDLERYTRTVKRYAVWNFTVNVFDNALFGLSISFVFSSTVLPLYTGYLTSSAILIGLVSAMQQVGYYLPQLLMARRGEKLRRTKPTLLVFALLQRIPYCIIALTILLFPNASPAVSLTILITCIALAKLCGGSVMPLWKKMVGKLIHPDRRGLFFGMNAGFGSLMGIGGAAAARYFLDTIEFPGSFGICFGCAFIFQMISYLFLCLIREPEDPQPYVPVNSGSYLRQLGMILSGNRNFSRYLVSQFLIILGTMGTGFYILYAKTTYGISDSFAGSMTLVAMIGQSVGTLGFGWLGDKRGHKWLTQISILIGAAAVLILLIFQGVEYLYPVFVLSNLSMVCLSISRSSITMEFCGVEKLPTYTALSGTLIGIPLLAAPVIGGWILEMWGYPVLFISALAAAAAGWIILMFGVRDPRKDLTA